MLPILSYTFQPVELGLRVHTALGLSLSISSAVVVLSHISDSIPAVAIILVAAGVAPVTQERRAPLWGTADKLAFAVRAPVGVPESTVDRVVQIFTFSSIRRGVHSDPFSPKSTGWQ